MTADAVAKLANTTIDRLEAEKKLMLSRLRDIEEKTFKAWLVLDSTLDLVRDSIAEWEEQ